MFSKFLNWLSSPKKYYKSYKKWEVVEVLSKHGKIHRYVMGIDPYKRFEMMKLKTEVNKSAVMQELRKEADKKYENSWESEYTKENFIKGAEALLKLLRLDDVDQDKQLDCDHEWKVEAFDCYGIPHEKYCEHCGKKQFIY